MKWAWPTFFMAILEKDKHITEEVKKLAQPMVKALGIELVDVEYVRGPSGMVLRLTIDKNGGVSLDDCVEVSHVVGDMLDVHDPVPGAYNLEVSSPGINRPLKTAEDFDRFSGEKAYVETLSPLDNRRRFRGVLRGGKGGNVIMECHDGLHEIPMEQIKKARLDIL